MNELEEGGIVSVRHCVENPSSGDATIADLATVHEARKGAAPPASAGRGRIPFGSPSGCNRTSNCVELLTQHIEKENVVLFDRADRILSDDEDENVAAAFEHYETNTVGVGAHTRLQHRIDGLASNYLAAAVG